MATKVNNKTKWNTSKSTKNGFLFTLLCILLFYPPFFRGLFFEKELLITHLFTFGLSAIWAYTKLRSSDQRILRSIPDLLGFAIVGLYFVSIFYGVNTRLAIGEFLKYANYFMIYLLVRDFTLEDEKNKKTILHVLFLSGVVVSLIGIGSAIGTLQYNGAFVGGRINSTFQYPNALASYLFALFILDIGLLQNGEDLKEKYFYAAVANLFIFTFIPTFSRGMWLLAPMIFVMYLLLIPIQKKIGTMVYGAIAIIPATIMSLLFTRGMESPNPLIQWGWLFVSIGMTIGLIFLCEKQVEKINKISLKHILTIATLFILITGIITGVIVNVTQPLTLSNMESEKDTSKSVSRNIKDVLKNKTYRLEVDTIANNPEMKNYAGRIDIYSINNEGKTEPLLRKNIVESQNLSLNFTTLDTTESIRIRFLNYYKDTEVTFDHAKLYDEKTGEKIKDIKLDYKYIPEKFIARIDSYSVQNNSLQARVAFYEDAFTIIKDYPILGAGGGAWETLYFSYQSYMYWSTQAHNHIMQLWIEIGTLGLILYIGLILSLVWSVYKGIKNTDDVQQKMRQLTIGMAALALITHSIMDFDLSLGAMSILLWTLFGMIHQKTWRLEKFKTNNKAIAWIAISISLCIVIGSASLHLGQQNMRKAIISAQNNQVQEAFKHFEKAIKLDAFNASYHIDLATLYALAGKQDKAYNEKAMKEAARAIELEPYNAKLLKKVAQINLEVGQFEEGLMYVDKAVIAQPMNTDNYLNQTQVYLKLAKYFIDQKNEEGIKLIADKIPSIKETLYNNSQVSLQPFKYEKQLDFNLQKLTYLFEHKTDSVAWNKTDKVVLYSELDMDIDQNELPDGTRISNREKGMLQAEKAEQYIGLTNKGTDYGLLWIDNLELKENKQYTLTIDYSSTVADANFDIYIYDYSDKSKTIGRLNNIKKSKEFTNISLDFTTPKGITSGKQRIGIIHRGNDPGEIKIKKVSILQE